VSRVKSMKNKINHIAYIKNLVNMIHQNTFKHLHTYTHKFERINNEEFQFSFLSFNFKEFHAEQNF